MHIKEMRKHPIYFVLRNIVFVGTPPRQNCIVSTDCAVSVHYKCPLNVHVTLVFIPEKRLESAQLGFTRAYLDVVVVRPCVTFFCAFRGSVR